MGSAGDNTRGLDVLRKFESGNDVRQIVSCSEGGRALRLLKRREETKARAEAARAEIENETKKRKFSSIDEKFGGNAQADYLEEEFKKQTVGLISIDEFRAKRKAVDEIIEAATKGGKNNKMRLQRKVQQNKLSFQDDEDADELAGVESDSEEEEAPVKKKHLGKDPSVNTSFLYDVDREEQLQRKKQELIREYHSQQDEAKQERMEITYSYWDGSGHRRTCVVPKGWTIGQFLAKCKKELEKTDFPELRATPLDSLMYVKEDMILEHKLTFFELIKEKARGKTGPLFTFDVKEDLRPSDTRIAKESTHAGKIVDRKWYERNKHVFPASRWEVYDKNKKVEAHVVGELEPLRSTLKG